jgi:transmembrane sensor
MSYKDFNAEDFFHDSNFRKWVLQPDPEVSFFWEKWLLNNPEKQEELAMARKMVKGVQIEEYSWSEEGKNKVWKRIQDTNQSNTFSNNGNSKVVDISNGRKKSVAHIFRSSWLKAAVISGVVLTSIYFLQNRSETVPEEPVITMVEKQNPKGQKSKVFLPDGSVVHLNSNSKLVYPKHFEEGKRHVKLFGEAFFEVVGDSLNPFVVESHQLVTHVLGTSFNVKDYPEQQDAEVSLVKGKVQVQLKENEQELLLHPGEFAIRDARGSGLNTGKFNYLANVAWKDGILYFEETALDMAFSTLEQWYGVSFTFNRMPATDIKVTGKFDNEYLTNVLKSLSYSISFDYEIKNGTDVKIEFD